MALSIATGSVGLNIELRHEKATETAKVTIHATSNGIVVKIWNNGAEEYQQQNENGKYKKADIYHQIHYK